MATKKERKAKQIRARKKKQQKRIGIIGAVAAVCIGFLIFFFITLFDSLFPPTEDRVTRPAVEEKAEVTLFFADANERFLVPEIRFITRRQDNAAQAQELVQALIGGSTMGATRTLPSGTKLIDISVSDDSTAVVNFDRNIIDLHPGGSASEIMTVYSVANTLITNIEPIDRVSFKVEGRTPRTLKGHIDTGLPFRLNEELIIRE